MESLSKQQLVLLALLVSFVTSLMTGIVTVSLMDQAPGGVTRTITQVIQKTVADASGATSTAAVAIAVNDQVADATAAVTPSIVRLRDGETGPIAGIGVIVSPSGVIMADKNVFDSMNAPIALYPDGKITPVAVVRFQADGDIAFLAPTQRFTRPAKAITFGAPPRLGSSVWSLSGTSSYTLSQGIVNKLDDGSNAAGGIIGTTISGVSVMPGAPLFDALGNVVGIGTSHLSSSTIAQFYPIQAAKAGVPQ